MQFQTMRWEQTKNPHLLEMGELGVFFPDRLGKAVHEFREVTFEATGFIPMEKIYLDAFVDQGNRRRQQLKCRTFFGLAAQFLDRRTCA